PTPTRRARPQTTGHRLRHADSRDHDVVGCDNWDHEMASHLVRWLSPEATASLLSHSCSVLLLDTATGRTSARLPGCGRPAFSRDSQSVTTYCDDDSIKVWALPPETRFNASIPALAFVVALSISATWLYARRDGAPKTGD